MVSAPTYDDAHVRAVLTAVKTVAMVGASPKPERPSYHVMEYLQKHGYRVIPINPGQAGGRILGEAVYASLAEVPAPFEMVDIFRNAEAAGAITAEALDLRRDKGITTLWMQLDIVNPDAAARAEAAGLTVIMDRCPKIEHARLF